ncbi:ABC transporter permease [Bordetella trematum]|uniref:ABC transporter permease n=1 Tax=Bordetella trematum TaxID=123899 RepID=UPI003AF374E4
MLLKRSSLTIVQAVLFALILREIRGKFGSNRLGGFWFIFEPFAHVVLMLIIFSLIRAPMINGVPLILFLVNGIVPFLLFKNITLTGMQAVNANRGLFAYRQIQAFDMILARAIVETSLMGLVYTLILACLWLWGGMSIEFNDPILWVSAILIGLVFSFSLAIIFCVLISNLPERWLAWLRYFLYLSI